MTQSNTSPNSFMQQNEREASRTRSPRGRSPSGRMSRWWHPPECLFYKTKSGCRFGEKCSYAHRQVDEQPTKRSTKNDDKSAVAMLKKGDWYESPVINQGHDRPGQPGKKRGNEMERGPSKHRSSNARQLGCVFQDEAAEVYFREEHEHAETNPTCEIHEGYCASHENSRPKSFARIHLPR